MSQVQIPNLDHCIWRARINHLCKSGLDPIDCKSSFLLFHFISFICHPPQEVFSWIDSVRLFMYETFCITWFIKAFSPFHLLHTEMTDESFIQTDLCNAVTPICISALDLSLVNTSHVTWILASDIFIELTRVFISATVAGVGGMSYAGLNAYGAQVNIGFWLVNPDTVIWILISDWSLVPLDPLPERRQVLWPQKAAAVSSKLLGGEWGDEERKRRWGDMIRRIRDKWLGNEEKIFAK